jgi:arylsulfatase A-like enzyme
MPTLAAVAVTASAVHGPAVGKDAGRNAARVAHRPNIVLIMTDDQIPVELRWMPHTRALLGDAGVTFTDALAPNPVCAPSRATLLTGQYSHNTGIRGNHFKQRLLHRSRLLPTWLHAVGYRTGFTGKYVNRYRASGRGEPGWDSFSEVRHGAHYYGYTMSNNGDPVRYPDVHVDDTVAADTTALINRFAGDRPFFIWSSYPAPHGACVPGRSCSHAPVPAVRHAGLYAGVVAPQLAKPSFNEADMSDKPRPIRGHRKVDAATVQHIFTERIRSLASVDEGVASTVAALRDAGELDDTLIVFTSDNGFQLGEHRYVGKVLAYEESVGVPLLMRGPGVPRGRVRGRTVTMADLAPTLAAAAGARPKPRVDGRNLGPYLRTGRLRPFTAVLESGSGNNWFYRAVRTERYTFVRWRHGQRELYDRRADHYQLRNVARVRRYEPAERALAGRLRVLESCAGHAACGRTFRAVPPPTRRPR